MLILELFFINIFFYNIFFFFFNSIDPLLQSGLFIFTWNNFYYFPQNLSFFFGIKFLLSIAFLILIRGGTPRYRYDYLTKLGWLKFLGFVLLIFSTSTLLYFLF